MLGTDRVTGNTFQGSIADCTKTMHLESESWAHRMALIILYWETDSSKLCSRAMKKSSLGCVDSVLHSRECSEGKGESEEKPRLNSAGCQDILHWSASAFLQPPGAQLAPGSLSSTEGTSFIRVSGAVCQHKCVCKEKQLSLSAGNSRMEDLTLQPSDDSGKSKICARKLDSE